MIYDIRYDIIYIMDYREACFCAPSRRRSFFMDELNDVIFYESEIVEDDDDAPVGTLVHIYNQDTTIPQEDTAEDPSLAIEEPIINDAPVEVVEDTPVVEEEPIADEVAQEVVDQPIVEETPVEIQEVASDQTVEQEPISEPTPTPAPEKKPRAKKTPVKSEESEHVDTSHIRTAKLEDSNNVSNTLHNTDFAIDEPASNQKVVSTKEKQEKAEDLWAVAPIAKKTPAKKATPKVEEPKQDAPKKKAPAKKATPKSTVEEEPAVQTVEETTPQESVENTPVEKKSPARKASNKAVKTEATVVAPTDPSAPEENTPKKKAPAKKKVDTTTNEEPEKVENTKAEEKMTKEPAKKATTKANDHDEKVLIPGDDSAPHGKFVVKHTEKDHYVYKLYSYNYRVVAIGAEQYASLASCKGGINSVIKNAATAPIEDLTLKTPVEQKCPKWVIYKDKKEEFRLRLIAANGNIVATTNDGYLSKDSAKKGIEAIARAAKGAAVVRNDNLW